MYGRGLEIWKTEKQRYRISGEKKSEGNSTGKIRDAEKTCYAKNDRPSSPHKRQNLRSRNIQLLTVCAPYLRWCFVFLSLFISFSLTFLSYLLSLPKTFSRRKRKRAWDKFLISRQPCPVWNRKPRVIPNVGNPISSQKRIRSGCNNRIQVSRSEQSIKNQENQRKSKKDQ